MIQDGATMLGALLGPNAIRVPAWCFAQDQGRDPQRGPIVSFVGASAFAGPDGDHPLMFGRGHYEGRGHDRETARDRYTHYLLNGEVIFRPAVVVGTNALRGEGLSSLALGSWMLKELLSDGELIQGTEETLAKLDLHRRGR
jgi:hypothetical protein